ncbi:MAG: hypothetical protein II458_07050 [Oscillospiraceae bacterium]|nr:hypothetical protein [Oscillospiraceae bacterium]
MNRYLSILALAARHTIWKVLAITAAAAALAGWLMLRLPLVGDVIGVRGDGSPYLHPYTLEEIPAKSLATAACLAGFLAIMAVLCLNGCGFGAKTDYTVCRLRVEEWKAYLVWAAYYTVCLILYWAVMAAVCCWAMGRRVEMLAADPEYGYIAGPQSRLLAFYSSPFLHHLLPLRDIAVWVSDVFLTALCGASAMEFSRQQRKGRIIILPLSAAWLMVCSFTFSLGSWVNYVVPFCAIACLTAVMMRAMKRGDEADEVSVPTKA